MEVHPLHRYPKESLDTLLASIPFYKLVKSEDDAQYETLMTFSKIIEYKPGELLEQQKADDRWLYFLMRGQLIVVNNSENSRGRIIAHIAPGEVFGDMAFFLRQNSKNSVKKADASEQPAETKRAVSVMADPNATRILLFGTDMNVFGQLNDFKRISLPTKLHYYRNVVHNLRWKLEMFRVSHPDVEFASEHRSVKVYMGPKDSVQELQNLHDQACALSIFVVRWNRLLNSKSDETPKTLDVDSLDKLNKQTD